MVMLIIIFASIFSHVIALLGAPQALLALVTGLGLPQWAFFAAVFAFLLVIAYALEELSVMIILLPILFPLITGLGFDPVWFGIIMVVWLEIGLHHAAGGAQPLRDPGPDAGQHARATSRSAPRPCGVDDPAGGAALPRSPTWPSGCPGR